MKEMESDKRVRNFDEVELGYEKEEAVEEAGRCLFCKDPQCVEGCPVGIDIPGFIKLIKDGKTDKSLSKINEKSMLPAMCGRVCPQEEQCEKKCILTNAKNPINIGGLERFAADNGKVDENKPSLKKKGKIAIIGSGPAGLTCAAELAKLGYNATILEALHDTGGVLRYGIPRFRLPRDIVDSEVERIKNLGVKIDVNTIVGKTIDVDELKKSYDAIFIGVGAGLPNFMDIPGEGLVGVYSANEFLTRVNLMNAHKFPEYDTPVKKSKHCVVIGGGNVAMDAARVAKRLGSDVTIVYRRSLEEMPARKEEIRHAQEEGIKILFLTNPVKINGKEKVEGMDCVQMMLGDADEEGRRKPVVLEGSQFNLECDQVIVAIGTTPNPLLVKKLDIDITPMGTVIVDDNCRASDERVFAGGDIVSGAATVIKAMGDGQKAAMAIDEWLSNN